MDVVIIYRPSPLGHQSTAPFPYMYNLFQVPGANIMAVHILDLSLPTKGLSFQMRLGVNYPTRSTV
jgi:hypothetical protein